MGSSDKDSGIRRAEFAAALIRAGSDDRQALQFVYEATPAKLFGAVLQADRRPSGSRLLQFLN